jgi:hypothetical protein
VPWAAHKCHGIAHTVGHNVRRTRLVAYVALTVAFALVTVPGTIDSRAPSSAAPGGALQFRPVQLDVPREPATTSIVLDPANRSDGALLPDAPLLEPAHAPRGGSRPSVDQRAAPVGVIVVSAWHFDPNISWYGPGFYGKRTACGHAYTTTIMGVAHRTLPCGTRVKFKNPANGRTITVPVIDRGPYTAGRTWDLSGAACKALRHCYTGAILWRFP